MTGTIGSPRRSGVTGALRRAALPFALLAVLAGCNSATPPAATGPAVATNTAGAGLIPQTSPDIHRIEALGRTIYVLDNAAARATDLAFAQGADLRASDMRGWVTDTSGPGVLVRFIRQKGDRFEAAYDVTVDENGRAATFARPVDARLTPDQSLQFAARQLAIAQAKPPLCEGPYTTVVFRDPGSSNWRIYLLAATTDPDLKMFGGHQRILVSADGKRILSSENLSKTCLAPRIKADPGHTIAFSFITELLSPTPIETHVFANLLYRLPLLIMTADRRKWAVDQGRIWGIR
ncbi:hypothetical protein [Inquilinus sp.]|jgi:hypothetical protein|uniref:hypothetical protein n=1 Tax=Inquilinus sp. TaxID=1932117 RepID=UPI003784195C